MRQPRLARCTQSFALLPALLLALLLFTNTPASAQIEPDIREQVPVEVPAEIVAPEKPAQPLAKPPAIEPVSKIKQREAQWTASALSAIRELDAASLNDPEIDLAKWEKLRSELAAQRDSALATSLKGTLSEKIIQAQIDSLGSPPAQGETEAPAIAERRAELKERLAEARIPSRAAEDAYYRANVLIAEVDRVINTGERAKMLQRAQSPLWPSSIFALISEIGHLPTKETAKETPPQTGLLGEIEITPVSVLLNLLVAALFVAAGIFAQRRLIGAIDRRIARASRAGIEIVLTFFRDIAILVVPVICLLILGGLALLVMPVNPRVSSIMASGLIGGIFVVLGMWLGRSLFAPSAPSQRYIPVSNAAAERAYWVIIGLGFMLAVEAVLETVEDIYIFSDAASGVLPLLVISASGLLLWQLAQIFAVENLRTPETAEVGSALRTSLKDGEDHSIDFAGLTRKILKSIAVVLILIIAVGYVELSRYVMSATFLTLTIMAFAMLTFRRVVSIAGAVGRKFSDDHENARQLAPVALGFVLVLVSLPLILLAWGVRPAQMGDVISAVRNGVSFGGIRISIGDVVTFGLIFMLGYAITRWIQRLIQASILPRLDMDQGTQSALLTGIGYVGLTISALIAITSTGLDLSSLALVAGALSVGIGFGLQSVISNFVSGIILLIERPVREGDLIEVGGYIGFVERISVRSTRIRTFDRDDVIIPNSELITGAVRNRTFSGTLCRVELQVGIAYGSDVERAKAILMELIDQQPDILADPEPAVLLDNLGDSSLVLRLLSFIDDLGKTPAIKSELLTQIYKRFAEEGIEIPFPQQEITLKDAVRIETVA